MIRNFGYIDGMGLRERKKAETRIALSWAAIKLVVEHGYDQVRVEDIAAAANVSPRTFNNYFPSKAAAIAARHHDRVAQIADELRARPADEPLWEAITNAVLARFALGAERSDVPAEDWQAGVQLMIEHPAVHGEFLRADWDARERLVAAIAERTGTDADRDLYPRLVAGLAGAAIQAPIDLWRRGDPTVPFESLLRTSLGRLAAGIPHPEDL